MIQSRKVVPILNQADLLQRLNAIFFPKAGEFTESEIDTMLLEFCLNCPDPAAAMDAVVEAPQGSTAESVLEAVLAMPARSPASYAESALSLDHPLRHWRVQSLAV